MGTPEQRTALADPESAVPSSASASTLELVAASAELDRAIERCRAALLETERLSPGAGDWFGRVLPRSRAVSWLFRLVEASLENSDRGAPLPRTTITYMHLSIDPLRQRVGHSGRVHQLTGTEWLLLTAFLAHPGEVLSRQQLVVLAWGARVNRAQEVEVYVSRLRRKVELDPTRPQLIETVRGHGYRLAANHFGTGQVILLSA